MFERGLVHFVASDAHDAAHRPPRLREARDYVARRWGQARAETLFVTNPRAVIEGQDIELEEVDTAPPKKWYQIWR